MSASISGSLPKGEANRLAAISRELLRREYERAISRELLRREYERRTVRPLPFELEGDLRAAFGADEEPPGQ